MATRDLKAASLGFREIELRRFFELEDFGPSEAVERHRELGKEIANKR